MAQMTDVTNMDQAMKILFTDPIVENVVTDTELLSAFQVDNNVQYEKSTGGRYIETAQYFQLPAGVGFRASNEYIPVPNGPVIDNSRIFLKKAQGVVEMTGDVMGRVRGDLGAYVDWMERALPDLVTRLNNTIDRVLLGYGNGAKARVNQAVPTVSMPIDTAFGASIGGTALTNAILQFLEGERIVFSANANGNPLRNPGATQSSVVTGINYGTSTLTLDAIPAATADNDYIFDGDVAGVSAQASGVDREAMGLLGMVDDGTILATFQNLSRATYRLWNCTAVDAANAALFNATGLGALTEDVLMYADQQNMIQGGGKVDLIVTSYDGIRSYVRSLRAARNINDPRQWTGGTMGSSIMLGDREINLKAARKMPPELCFGLQRSTFKRWELEGYQWDDKTGAIWNRVTDASGRKDAFFAVGNWYFQTGCLAPAKNFRVHKINPAANR